MTICAVWHRKRCSRAYTISTIFRNVAVHNNYYISHNIIKPAGRTAEEEDPRRSDGQEEEQEGRMVRENNNNNGYHAE
jgi:hypothetical protein